jgi:hypothetical protein
MRKNIRLPSMILVAVAFTCQPLAFAREGKVTGRGMAANNLRGLPDLVVRNVRLGDPTVGEFFVTVKNNGQAKASDCRLRLTLKDKSGQAVTIVEEDQSPVEANGGSIKIRIATDKGLPAYLKYEVTTDFYNKVAESDERNNTWVGNTGKV